MLVPETSWEKAEQSRVRNTSQTDIEQSIQKSIIRFPAASARVWLAHLVAALCSDVWQKRKRSSFKPLVKAYLVKAIVGNVAESNSKLTQPLSLSLSLSILSNVPEELALVKQRTHRSRN